MAKFEPRPFGKYFLTDLIAIGGMAEIYKAKTFGVDGFEKVLAIKKILQQYSADKEFITMLTDEAKLVVNLSHANIVQVYDLGRVDDDYFISMEHIDGINMRDLVEKAKILGEKIPPEICVYIASEVCKGLDYAHNKRDENGNALHIVHRDISPQNILVSYDGGVKIVDFGIAKAAHNLSQTNLGILKGKVTYMAPEQAFGKPIDGRTDLFSLGIVLYEMLTLNRLFTGDSQMEVLKKIRNSQISENSFGDDIPLALKKVLAKALSYSVKGRYQTASDFQIDLTRILYSHYSDFSPRKLSVLLQLWFQQQINRKQKEEESRSKIPEETILVSSAKHEVDLVHRDQTQSAMTEDPWSDTIRPEDKLTKEKFETDTDLVQEAEQTEKSHLSSHEETINEMLEKKRRRGFWRKLLVILIPLAAVGLFFLFRDQADKPTPPIDVSPAETVDLNLVTTPEGAAVFVNDIPQEAETPLTITKLEVDKTYIVRVQKQDFETVEQTVAVTKDMATELTMTLKPITAATYVLAVQSIPSGAKIILDGQETGFVTPASLKDLKLSDTHKISLRLEKYQPYEKEFVPKGSGDQKLDVVLDAIPLARVNVTSTPPGADIYLDGLALGQSTPFVITHLPLPQTVTIKLEKEGYEVFEKPIELTEGKEYVFEAPLIKKQELIVPVPLRVTTNLAGASVSINGEHRGVTPLSLQLVPGRYTIVVSHEKYKSQTKNIDIVKGQKQQDYYFKLSPTTQTTTQQQPANTTQQHTTVPTQTSPIENTTSQNQAYARLRVDSSPRGASVKINGAPAGVTPIVVGSLPKNRAVSISVSKSGYKSWNMNMTLTKDYTEVKAVLTQ